jgi:hypothetical protein
MRCSRTLKSCVSGLRNDLALVRVTLVRIVNFLDSIAEDRLLIAEIH